ncbi:MAG: serine hydrolase [Porphyrobacter sp.]|nr:serine hydrolase [Porphyrobacter sp.]
MKRTLIAAAAAALAASGAAAASGDGALPAAPAELRERLDAAMPGWLAKAAVPSAAVALIADGKVAWTAVYGERAPGEPAQADTLYNVASLTKPLVAETVLRLAAAGRLDLDAPISDLFTDRDLTEEPRAAKLTLRNALSHRTGFPANWRAEMPGGKLRIEWEPGTRAFYSGENYVLAARYAMQSTQTRLDYLVRDMVFAPAGMSDTWFLPDAAWEGRVAMVRGPDGALREPDNSPQGSAADNVHATIGDYAAFVAGAMAGTGLTPELVAERGTIYDDQTQAACPPALMPQEMCPEHAGYGLGWMVYDSGDHRFLLHNGKDWGERTIALFAPEERFGVVVFTSGANGRQVISDTLQLLIPDRKLNALVAAEARFEEEQRAGE